MLPNLKTRLIALSLIILSLAVLGIAEASEAQANEANVVINAPGEDDLAKQHCEDSKEAMSACRSFIKGFLQGALLTDAAILENIEAAKDRSTFKQRALKTRVSGRSSSPTELAGFCLPVQRTILDLANETLDHVKQSKLNSRELAKSVYASLKTDFPCSG